MPYAAVKYFKFKDQEVWKVQKQSITNVARNSLHVEYDF